MPSPRKHRTPPIAANLTSAVRPISEQPLFRPWGVNLQLWDVGPHAAMCSASVTDLSPRERKVIGDYMVALWTTFRDYPGAASGGKAAARSAGTPAPAGDRTESRTVRKIVSGGRRS